MRLQTTRWWDPPKVYTIWGVTTHVSDPNRKVTDRTVT